MGSFSPRSQSASVLRRCRLCLATIPAIAPTETQCPLPLTPRLGAYIATVRPENSALFNEYATRATSMQHGA